MKNKVCDRCGGSNVFYDAYVGVNDPKDIRTFDATFCDDCGTACGLREGSLWVLLGGEIDEYGSWAFWSNEDGWVDRESATVFTEAERRALRSPLDAACWQAVG